MVPTRDDIERLASELMIDEDAKVDAGAVEERPFGWLVFVNSPQFLLSRDPMDAFEGMGPLVFLRDARFFSCGSGHSTEAICEAADFVYRGGFRPLLRVRLALELMKENGRLYQNEEDKIFGLLSPGSWGHDFYTRWLAAVGAS